MIDSQIPKTLAGLEGLLNLPLQKAEGLVDFGEILNFIYEIFENQANLLSMATAISFISFHLKLFKVGS